MTLSSDFARLYAGLPRGYTYTETPGGVGLYRFPALSAVAGLTHGFTARTGGVSEGCYASLNLSFTRAEERESVLRNFGIFCREAGLDGASLVLDAYEHGASVLRVDRADCGRGYTREPLPPCDGIITNDPAVTLVTGHADCMAFYAVDPVRRALGLAHAGWRGALARVGVNLINQMRGAYGCAPEDIIACVGPSLCQTHFEVDEAVADSFCAAFPGLPCRETGKPGKAHIDLWLVAAAQLLEAGLSPARISLSGVCSYEDERLYSYRRERGKTGCMVAYMRLDS